MSRVNGRKMSLAQAARLVLHGDEEDEEERRREPPRRIISLPRVAWLEKKLAFWDDRGFAVALAERRKEIS